MRLANAQHSPAALPVTFAKIDLGLERRERGGESAAERNKTSASPRRGSAGEPWFPRERLLVLQCFEHVESRGATCWEDRRDDPDEDRRDREDHQLSHRH